MKRLRLLLVTRQFWPLVGGAQVVLAQLAHALQARGAEVVILTAQWEKNWPRELQQGGVRVVRLPQPRLRFVGTWSYMRALRRWLAEHAGAFDLVYVSMLKHDAYVALAAPRTTPVVLRPECTGATGDIYWQQHAPFGRRIAARCKTADAIVAISEPVRHELLTAGYPAERLTMIANGVPIPPPRTAEDRAAARRELAQAQRDLALPLDARLVVFCGRLHPCKGLEALLAAWPRVVQAEPRAKLWLVGEGPQRPQLLQQIAGAGVDDSVQLVGRFDAVDDFLRAADAFVLPSREELMSIALLEAMAAGLPVVASDIPGNRTLVRDGENGLLTPVDDPPALAAALTRVLTDPAWAAEQGRGARRDVEQNYSLAKMADAHWELFHQLLSRHDPCGREPSDA